MGRSDRRELLSRLVVLVSHLPKWQSQPDHRSSSWLSTISEQRRQIERKLGDFPSLRPALDEMPSRIYADARLTAARETGIPQSDFPPRCPFAVDDVLSASFLPE